MIDQIRHLQSATPFQTFAIELANSRVIQISDPYKIATSEGNHAGEYVLGVLHGHKRFEVISGSQIVAVSVGVHPETQAAINARLEYARKIHERTMPEQKK